jgi:putative drug exporter of the RND superfamily
MERWTRRMIRRRRVVLAVWLLLLLVGGATWGPLADLLTNRFTLPGTDTARAERILQDHFGQKSTGSFTIVARTEPGRA